MRKSSPVGEGDREAVERVFRIFRRLNKGLSTMLRTVPLTQRVRI